MGLDVAIKSVARHVNYSPETIGNLYFDEVDYYGLIYWYEDAKLANKQIKEAAKSKPSSKKS